MLFPQNVLPRVEHDSLCMQKVDGFDWTVGRSFHVHGHSIGVRANDDELLNELTQDVPVEWQRSDQELVDVLLSLELGKASSRRGRQRSISIYSGAARVARTQDPTLAGQTFDALIGMINRFWGSNDYLFLHAGVVGWKGRAIVIPGRSFSGKTTLVVELVKAGATHYADTIAIFDRDGRVHPNPAPMCIRDRCGKVRIAPQTLRALARPKPLDVSLIVSSRFDAGACWRPHLRRRGRAILKLLESTLAVQREPAQALPILEKIVHKAAVIESRRNEASEILERVFRLLDSAELMHC